ncbi:DUF819 family protein [Sulfurimonas sp. HSL-1716]|uniref:DUF819 family protein n=1 Tax=Hydrocurvibacter sulfurireducens TaxID=3131937 RepID=UPI0031F97242
MITSPLLYLLIIAAIGTFFGYLKQKSRFKVFSSHIYIILFIFIGTSLLSYLGIFANTQEIKSIYHTLKNNLLPAMIFLTFTDLDLKNLLKGSGIGCSCNIGPKRYWFLLALSFFVSLASQFLSLHTMLAEPFISAVVLSAFFGILASFTPLKNINGIKDIAATMLYLLAALFASQIR